MNKNLIIQILISYGIRGSLILVGFFTVPITIQLLGKSTYGEWVIILSVMSWVAISDFGINSGLRNFVTKNIKESTQLSEGVNYSFTVIALISTSLLLILFPVLYFSPEYGMKLSLFVCLIFVFINFPFSISTSILHGVRKTPLVLLGQLVGSIFIFICIYVAGYFNFDSPLIIMALIYGLSLLLTSVFSWYFVKRIGNIKLPRVIKIKNSKFSFLLNSSSQFFAISVSILIIMNTDYVIVLYLFGSELVTEYFSYEKIYSIYNTLFSLMLIPIWSFISKALVDRDINWIKGLLQKVIIIYIISSLLVICIYTYATEIITMWLGLTLDSFLIPVVNISFALGALILAWNGIFSTILNGLDYTRVQMYCYIFAAIFNIPISYYLSMTLGLGISGVKLGTVSSLMITSIILPIQTYKVLYVKNTL